MTSATMERERCLRLCDGLVLAIEIASGPAWSLDQRQAAIAALRWLRDEINGSVPKGGISAMTYDQWKTTNPDDDFLGPKPFLCERCGTFCEPDKDAASKGWLCEDCAKIKRSPP